MSTFRTPVTDPIRTATERTVAIPNPLIDTTAPTVAALETRATLVKRATIAMRVLTPAERTRVHTHIALLARLATRATRAMVAVRTTIATRATDATIAAHVTHVTCLTLAKRTAVAMLVIAPAEQTRVLNRVVLQAQLTILTTRLIRPWPTAPPNRSRPTAAPP